MSNRKVVGLKIVEESVPENCRFLKLEWLRVVNLYEDGSCSKPYNVDVIHRPAFDAVSVTLYYIDSNTGKPMVAIREALRPAIYFGRKKDLPLKDDKEYLWVKESVAGSIEKSDRGKNDINKRMSLEITEETGFDVPAEELKDLGAGFFPSHGQCSEKIYMRVAEVNINDPKREPKPDSPMEEGARLQFAELSEAIRMCHKGDIEDPKLEIGFRRLASYIGYIPELKMWADDLPEDLKKNYDNLDIDN